MSEREDKIKEMYAILDDIRGHMNDLHENTAMLKGRVTMGAIVDEDTIDDLYQAADLLKQAKELI